MKKEESKDYEHFRGNVPEPKDRLDRVENIVITGMPDVNYCADGIECWIEFKHPTEPKRATTPLFGSNHKLSQDQKNWFLRQKQAGGYCFILIATDKRWMLIDGKYADLINEKTVDELHWKYSEWCAMKPITKRQYETLREVIIESCKT
jgi:hypothetical protein